MPMLNMHWHFLFIRPMELDACFKIGFVQKTHGLKGEVTIALDAGAPSDFETVDALFLEMTGRLVPYFIGSFSLRGTKGFVKFEDVETLDDAARLVKSSVYLPKSMRPKSRTGEFYDDEILHFKVLDETYGALGTITEVMQAGPNRLLVLDHDGKEVLIPLNSPFITHVDKRKKVLTTSLPDGYLTI